MKHIIPFSIERVDGLGQGVSFDPANEKVNFIPKTLPGEKGTAEVIAKKGKKVQFAKLESVTTKSPDRIDPPCIHFNQCPSCAFLHTTYEKECELKKESYSFLFRKYFDPSDIVFTKAPRRLIYRNRIQLHYDKRQMRLGFIKDNEILPVPQCQLPHPQIQERMGKLYENDSWVQYVKDQPNRGHIELYLTECDHKIYEEKEYQVSMAVNQRYAHAGFTQVFQEMNQKIIDSIDHFFLHSGLKNLANGLILDLFGGDGNLSRSLGAPTVVVDYYTSPRLEQNHQKFLSQNLYDSDALDQLTDYLGQNFSRDIPIQWLIIDPPRSGLKNLNEFVDQLSPEKISYLSCNPNTQIRDITPLLNQGWKIDSIEFLDLFPSTHHLESFVHLKKA